MARDSFFTEYDIVEEKKLGPITLLLFKDPTLVLNSPNRIWGYASRTDFKTAVQDKQLQEETHVILISKDNWGEFDGGKEMKLGDCPDDAVCFCCMSGDTEEEMRNTFNNACEEFKHYGEKG